MTSNLGELIQESNNLIFQGLNLLGGNKCIVSAQGLINLSIYVYLRKRYTTIDIKRQ